MASSDTKPASEGTSMPQVHAERDGHPVPEDRPTATPHAILNAPRRRCIRVRLVDMAIASVACLFLVVQFLPGVRSKG
ncbi:MAG: hypothetical protein ACFNXZ_13465 [Lautropia mirabilis]